MEQLPSGGGSIHPQPNENECTPLWEKVTKIYRIGKTGGNWRWKCNFCNQDYSGSYSRVKYHLLRISKKDIKICPKVTQTQIVEMQQLVDQAEARVEQSIPKRVPLPFEVQTSSSTRSSVGTSIAMGIEPKRRRGDGNSEIEKAFNLQVRRQLDGEIARMFISASLSFNLARNPHFQRAFSLAANNNLCGYKPPGYNLLRTRLLNEERQNVEKLLAPIKHTWKEKGVSIVSDGWTDVQRRPLINIMAVCENGPMFLKAVNTEGEIKSGLYIASLIKDAIQEVGPQNVVQFITDNAPVCKSAGALVEAQFPHIFWTPCVVHTLNLALKNICASKNTEANEIVYNECHWITTIAEDASIIKNFIVNHSMRLAIFNQHSKLKLLSVAETRFASVIIMLKRFKEIKHGLMNMVISEEWASYREDDVGKAQFVKEKLLNDLWWDKIEYILSFTEPIYAMIRVADTDRPCLHLIYDMWDTMIENVRVVIYRAEKKEKDEESQFYEVVRNILVDRWNKSNRPLHCLAHSLNPMYYSEQWLSADKSRVPPHRDDEICVEGTKCLKRYFTDSESRRIVNVEFAKFSGSLDDLRDIDCMNDRGLVDPKSWWLIYGSSIPHLQSLALKLLCQPCSSSCFERNWSTYSFLHSAKRNKMTPQRAEDLVFTHTNLRLLGRRDKSYEEGDTKMWDVGGDNFDMFDGAGMLEFVNLSLDEPELEAGVYEDDGEDTNMTLGS